MGFGGLTGFHKKIIDVQVGGGGGPGITPEGYHRSKTAIESRLSNSGERKVSGTPLGAPAGRPQKGSKKGQKKFPRWRPGFWGAGRPSGAPLWGAHLARQSGQETPPPGGGGSKNAPMPGRLAAWPPLLPPLEEKRVRTHVYLTKW